MSNLLLKNNHFIPTFLLISQLVSGLSLAVDFDTVYQSTLKNNSDLVAENASLEEARALLKSADSNFFPHLGIESRYESYDSSIEKTRGNSSNAFVEWNLFNGFKDLNDKKSLKATFQSASISKQRLESNLKWITLAKYVDAKIKQDNVRALKRTIESNEKNLKTVKLRKSTGRLLESELIEFQLFDSKLKQQLISFESKALAAISELEVYSGLSSITQLTSRIDPKRLKIDKININELASSSHSKLNELKYKIESIEAKKSMANSGYLPEINFKASYGSLGLKETTNSPETKIGIVARWEFFSGFQTVNNQSASNSAFIKEKAELDNRRQKILSRTEQLKTELKNILSRIEFEKNNQRNIDRFLISIQTEYKRGVKNSNDLKSALELALDTEINRNQLMSDYFQLRAELQDMLGFELEEE
jgi:outer membrane protein